MSDIEREIAQLRRDFSAGLPERLERMHEALVTLGVATSRDAIESVYLAAHSLKGTARVYGANEVADCAAALSQIAGEWYEAGAMNVGELPVAVGHLDALRGAVAQYRRDVEPGTHA